MTDQDRIRDTYRAYDESGRARLWDPANRGYARMSRDREAALAALLDASIPVAGGAWLDVGCGDGSLIRATLARRAHVAATGLDLLPDRIEAARTAGPAATFVVGSADALPFVDGSFDVVSAITLFSSLPTRDLERAVANEITRVLRPGGWLVWYDLRYDNPSNPAVHGLGADALRALFPRFALDVHATTLLPPLARRLGRSTPIAYPLLQAIPPLRSHLIGRLRCPG